MKNDVSISSKPDGWLLREWRDGNERAAEILIDRYSIRLVALVAKRMSQRYRSHVDPDEVVQSALGSFFNAARFDRIHASESTSLWNLLATFARRKLSRVIERSAAFKRGGDCKRLPFEQVASSLKSFLPHEADVDELMDHLKAELPHEHLLIVEGLLAGQTQKELAVSLEIDERTIRRRLTRIRAEITALDPTPETKAPDEATTEHCLPSAMYSDFILSQMIGSGGFGKVYRAVHRTTGKEIAVKFLRKAFWKNEEGRRSFLHEINAASQLIHPNVIRYIGYGESPQGGPFIISQWISGCPMQSIDRPNEARFTAWLTQICETIQAVHNADIIHGDLTPGNILIDQADHLTITDSGFSQSARTASNQLLGGTLGFAAPEQINPAFGDITTQTDLYAIGGLMHWYFYGTPPNTGQTIADTLVSTLTSVHDTNPDAMAPQAHAVMLRCLSASPAERPKSAAEILRAIRSD